MGKSNIIQKWDLTLKIKHKLPENRINNIKYLSAFVLGVFGFIAIGSAFI
jgi:hypothetical protein